MENLPALKPGWSAECRLCGAHLEQTNGRSITAGLGCPLGTFLLLFPANLLPLLAVRLFRMQNQNRICSGIFALWDNHWFFLAALTGAFAVFLPFVRFGLLSAVLSVVRFRARQPWLGPAFRWAMWLDIWAMPDVYLLAAFVGYYRLTNVDQMHVNIGIGGYFFIAAAFLAMVTRAAIDRRTVWRAIGPETNPSEEEQVISCTTCDLVQPASSAGKKCPRCTARLQGRKPNAVKRGAAMVGAAFILFFPANILPMNTSVQLGSTVNYTIFEGVRKLFEADLWPLGVIIFCTSILIPVLKIFGIAWCILSVLRRSRKHLVAKTKLYRFIAEIGRWSNVYPFTITVFVPLMTFQPFASSSAAWGSTAFIAVVVLTLLASMAFDLRLIWDAAERT